MTEDEIIKQMEKFAACMSFNFGIVIGRLNIIDEKLQLLFEKERDNDPLEQINKMAQPDKGA